MKIAWVAIATLVLAASSAAQPVTRPAEVAAKLGVDVLAPNGEVDAAAVREAIAAELAIDVGDSTAFAPSLGRLEVAVDRGVVRIAYHPVAGTLIERSLALPAVPEERIQIIAFVATNLVRDQMTEILAGLEPPSSAPLVVIPPIEAPPRRPAPVTRRFVPATMGFVPPISIDRIFGEKVVVGFGLHALVGVTDASAGASISGLVDVQRDYAHGVQIAGIATYAHRVHGLQVSGIAALAGDVRGAQVGGIATKARNVNGQVAGIGAWARDVDAFQIAGIGTVARNVDGAQVAGIASVARHVDGAQIAGIANVAREVKGVQVAGIANVAGDMRGVQVGVVNIARRARGVQVGVVNISENGNEAIPIGLINYGGRLAAEAWVDSSRMSAAGIRHGTRYVHNVWALAWSPDHDHVMPGAGLGVRVPSLNLDIDAMHWMTNIWNGESGQISQLRASLSVAVGNVELFGGVAGNLYISDNDAMDESGAFHPNVARRTTTDAGTSVVLWPSAFVGVRVAK